MSTVVKYVVAHTYKPLLEKYLSRKRVYRHNGFTLEIPPEVFHPGFFFSTRFLMRQLTKFSLTGKSLLELGAGSGLIAIHAAKAGARVTATDLNRTAVEYLNINARINGMTLDVIHSDLFTDVPRQQFDFIILNPPYYKRDPLTEKDLAWCCGSKGEYFERLFAALGNYMHDQSEVMMVLCDGCDIRMIQEMAAIRGFTMDCATSQKNLIETNYIFNIRRVVRNSNNNKLVKPKSSDFVQLYLDLRRKENRVYSDEELLLLPEIDTTHPLAKEWKTRKASADRLISYLTSSKKSLKILEIGCGNGWLSNKLAGIPGSTVVGIDVNQVEIDQAKRVFNTSQNLRFDIGTPSNELLGNQRFDVVVFAASIQYFEHFDEIIRFVFQYLNESGQIHIIDSYFYPEHEVEHARQRSSRYFAEMGAAPMKEFYFHHSNSSLQKFQHRVLFDPKKSMNRFFKRDQVFPWILIEKNR